MERKLKKVSIIVSRNGFEEVLPALIMANGARMEGIDAMLFFTSFGLDAIMEDKIDKLQLANKTNPNLTTEAMLQAMEKLDIPSIREFIEMIHDSGASIYACKATVDLWGIKKEDFCPEMDDIITVGQFYSLSDDAQIIFT